jgi:hypothetical protein
MTVACDQDMIVAALRGALPDGADEWTHRMLRDATRLPFMRVRSACTSLRMAGKIEFERLTLSASMMAVVLPPVTEAPSSASPDSVTVPGTADCEPAVPGATFLPDRPTGIQLAAEIKAWCLRHDILQAKFGPLAGRSEGLAYALKTIAFPTPATVAACRAVMGTASAPTVKVAMPDRYCGNLRTVSSVSGEITDFETLRGLAESAAVDRAARFAAVERAERAHRMRGQALLRATPAAAFIAKARAQMGSAS